MEGIIKPSENWDYFYGCNGDDFTIGHNLSVHDYEY